jgi:predicted nuclease of predicted toxin-antitoxin system
VRHLLDQGLPRSAAARLAPRGFDAVHTGDIGFATADDDVTLEQPRVEGRAVVTLDADLHVLLALTGATAPSVIRIRIEGLRAETLAELLTDVLKRCDQDLAAGAMVSVVPGRIRLRRLPLIP